MQFIRSVSIHSSVHLSSTIYLKLGHQPAVHPKLPFLEFLAHVSQPCTIAEKPAEIDNSFSIYTSSRFGAKLVLLCKKKKEEVQYLLFVSSRGKYLHL